MMSEAVKLDYPPPIGSSYSSSFPLPTLHCIEITLVLYFDQQHYMLDSILRLLISTQTFYLHS